MEGVPVCIGLEVGKEKRRKKGKKKKTSSSAQNQQKCDRHDVSVLQEMAPHSL